jgi:hypothetical protein
MPNGCEPFGSNANGQAIPSSRIRWSELRLDSNADGPLSIEKSNATADGSIPYVGTLYIRTIYSNFSWCFSTNNSMHNVPGFNPCRAAVAVLLS